jgi:hypothetical protein
MIHTSRNFGAATHQRGLLIRLATKPIDVRALLATQSSHSVQDHNQAIALLVAGHNDASAPNPAAQKPAVLEAKHESESDSDEFVHRPQWSMTLTCTASPSYMPVESRTLHRMFPYKPLLPAWPAFP